MSTRPDLLRTPLHGRHELAGARLTAFAGWEMPVYYEGPPSPIRHEHIAVREACGMFDVSHMGQIECTGPDALALLQRLLTNDVAKLSVGGAQYALLCREDGGVLDDLFTYRIGPERFLTVTNAANHRRDLEWFEDHADDLQVEVFDRLADYAMLAVQGPLAREVVQAIADGPLPARMTVAEGHLAGTGALICGTGYTGEDGVELLLDPERAGTVWDELCRRGATPAGLAARDTLRLEACFHLYGNDLSEQRNPIEGGLGWCCKEATGFIGAAAVEAARAADSEDRLVAFALEEPGIARQGNPIEGGGEVTSGTLSPCLGIGIGLGYVPAARDAVGSPLKIDVRGRPRAAKVHAKPFVRKHR